MIMFKRKIRLLILLACTCSWADAQDFITRQGDRLTVGQGGAEIYLRGICFGNQVWDNVALPVGSHKEADFRRVQDMGMNTVRFYMNYLTFEADANPYVYKPQGFAYLDTNVAWAKRHGIYLILNIHVPQGGFQSNCGGNALWKVKSNQDRLVALWKAITQRYANETQIAGYDLLNEPMPTDSLKQWRDLEQRIIDSVRTVDQNHLIFSEKTIGLNCDYTKNEFNKLNEEKLVYSIHSYDPYEYTTQLQAWANTGDGGKYPDESIISPPSDLTWGVGQYNNPTLPVGNSPWKLYKGKPFLVSVDTLIVAKPVFYGNNLKTGKAYFDEFIVNEVDASGQILNEIERVNVTSLDGLYYYTANSSGKMTLEKTGSTDSSSVSITGSTDYANVTVYSKAFKVEKGKRYAISGWMRGDSIPTGTSVSVSMELYYSPSHQPALARDKEYLTSQVLQLSKYPLENNYPIYYGEFGAVRDCFQNGKGGEIWVADMIHLFDSLHIHWTYHDYREDGFGLYMGTTGLVDTSTVNQSLKNTFEQYFGITTDLEIEDFATDMVSHVFPNPFKTSFYVENTQAADMQVALCDALGRRVAEQIIPAQSKALMGENLLPGMYYLHLQNSHKTSSFKVLKE
jgi:endoglucanase